MHVFKSVNELKCCLGNKPKYWPLIFPTLGSKFPPLSFNLNSLAGDVHLIAFYISVRKKLGCLLFSWSSWFKMPSLTCLTNKSSGQPESRHCLKTTIYCYKLIHMVYWSPVANIYTLCPPHDPCTRTCTPDSYTIK